MMTEKCNEFPCPTWATSEWSEVTFKHMRLSGVVILCRKVLQYKTLCNLKLLNFILFHFANNMAVMAIKISKWFGLF